MKLWLSILITIACSFIIIAAVGWTAIYVNDFVVTQRYVANVLQQNKQRVMQQAPQQQRDEQVKT